MEGNGSSESSSGSDKHTGVRTKKSVVPTSIRMQRNQAEKQRRDRLNGYISELATLVPMISNASKPMDKVSILRLAAAQMRLNISCLNPKKYKCKPVTLPPSVTSYLDVIEKTIGGFILATTFSGCIVFCSKSIEDYVGYQNIDVMGNSVFSYIHSGDVSYFEKKVNALINQKKHMKKKTKVIKVHMQQRPLSRSNDVRYRKMIFKLSVHVNDKDEGSISDSAQTSSKVKKTGRQKDYGASGVMLMFIEPVRLEPEIDISYIESHQDAYFTMHGLKGEIIYADQRISSITGYMPHDVQGTSAYQYINSLDVPIALFAQKAMFTSSDGTGVIVYRLRIRDMRFIYLQSSGQIAYKNTSSEISHFVCFNKLLSDEEGSQELKKFQQRFAPQIMASKMLQIKKHDKNAQPPATGLVLENPLSVEDLDLPGTSALPEVPASANTSALPLTSTLLKTPTLSRTSDLPRPSTLLETTAKKATSKVSRDSSSESPSSIAEKNLNESFVSPVGSTLSSIHSSEGHSLTSPVSDPGSTSNAPGYSGSWTYESPGERVSEQLDFSLHDQNGGSSLCNDYPAYNSSSYDSENVVSSERRFDQEVQSDDIDKFYACGSNISHSESYLNGYLPSQQSISYKDSKLQSKTMHSVNAFSTLQNGSNVIISEHIVNDPPVNYTFDTTGLQDGSFNLSSTLEVSNPTSCINNDIASGMNGQCNDYTNYNERDIYIQVYDERRHLNSTQNSLPLSVANSMLANPVHNQDMCFETEHLNDLTSFSGGYEISNSSLPKISNRLSIDSGLGETMDFSSSKNSYKENGSCSNKYISYNFGYNNSGIGDFYDLDTKPEKCREKHRVGNGCVPDLMVGFPTSLSFNNISDSTNVTVDQSHLNGDVSLLLSNRNIQLSINDAQNGSSDEFGNNSGFCTDSMDWISARINLDHAENGESNLNKELYRELDLFFQNLPRDPQDSCGRETFTGISVANNSCLPKSISSTAKTRYHQ